MICRDDARNAAAAFVRAGCDLRLCISSTGAPMATNSSEYSCVMRAVTKKAMILKSGSAAACARHASHSAAAVCSIGVTRYVWSTRSAVWVSVSPTVSTKAGCGRRAKAASWAMLEG